MFTRTISRRPQPSPPSAAPGLAVQPFLQPRLVVGPVDDPYEREADRVAEQVVQRVPGPLGISRVGTSTVQRCDEMVDDCAACRVGLKRDLEEEGADDDQDEERAEPANKRRKPSPQGADEEMKVLRRDALPASPSVPAGGTVAAAVEAGIHRAQGGGRPVPEPLRESMENSFGADFHLVRLHSDGESDRLNRSLSARAFTTGRDIFFRHGEYRPESRSGQHLLAHELTHVVQQGAARKESVQRQFAGPKLDNSTLADQEYKGHQFSFVGAVKPHTGCGIENEIRTAGEKVNNAKSNAGDPTNFARYRDGFSVKAGLVRDKTRSCAATRMHLINHRMENSDNTQQNPNNIMLGTQASNNPTHLHEVENPVIAALGEYGNKKNNELYEKAMKNAVDTKDPADKKALFWQEADKPDPKGVADCQEVYLIDGDETKGYRLPADKKAGDKKGFGLTIEGYAPGNNRLYHLWLTYKVTANYAGRPAYVDQNVTREENAAPAVLGDAKDALDAAELHLKNSVGTKKEAKAKDKVAAREQDVKDATEIPAKITDFKNNWADNAFPRDFTCKATYYTATYKRWGAGESYRVENETHPIASDL